ncbi:28717_t:CDS:2, partial [Gigaspora margarita]
FVRNFGLSVGFAVIILDEKNFWKEALGSIGTNIEDLVVVLAE